MVLNPHTHTHTRMTAQSTWLWRTSGRDHPIQGWSHGAGPIATHQIHQIGWFSFEIARQMGVSKNNGTPKSSILIGFSIITHPFWGTIIFGNTQIGLEFQKTCPNLVEKDFVSAMNCNAVFAKENKIRITVLLGHQGFQVGGTPPYPLCLVLDTVNVCPSF